MADSVNAFTVYSSLELQINEFVQQLNRASQILDSTLQNMSSAVSSLNIQPVEVNTEANTSAVQDVESAVSGINAPPVNILTEADTSAVWDVESAVSDMVVSPILVDTEPNLDAVNEIESVVSGINVSPVMVQTESNISGISEIENAISSMNIPTITINTETEPIEPVTVPPADDRNFVQKIKDSFSNLGNIVKSVSEHFKSTEDSVEELGETVTETSESGKKSMSEYKSDVMKLAAQYRSSGMDAKEALQKAWQDIDKSQYNFTQNSEKRSKETGNNWKNIGTNIANAFKSGVENAKNALKELPAKAAEVLKETGEKLKSIAETVAKSATVAISAVSAGIVAFGKSAVETGANFDKSMSQVAATMGKSVDEVSDLRAFAQEMGRTTAFSATDSADALNYMALAGYDAETSMAMLPNVLNLASAGGMELALASDMITDSQSALGLSLDETTQLVDKMAKASSKSNTSVSQLGDAILTVGGTAKKLKGGTTELATVLGILADNGIKGSEGGTALRNIMNSLISPTDDAIAMLDQMGTSLYDSEGNMRSLNDVFTDLKNGMSGLATQAEKDQVLTTIFNARDLKSAEALIANVGDRFNELSSAIDDSAGAADAMAKTQLDNLAGDVTLFQSALEGAKIAVSDQLTPTLRDFVKMGSDAMGEIAYAFESSDDLETAIFKVGRYLQKYIYQLVNKIFDALPQVISIAATLVSSIGQAIVKNIPKLANSAVELLKGFAGGITKNAPTAIKGFSDMLKNVADWIKQNGKTLISSGMEMIKSIANGISDNLPSMANSVKSIVSFLAETMRTNLPLLLDSALNIISSVGQGIVENLPLLINSAIGIIKSLATYLGENLPEIIPAVIDVILQIVETLTDPKTLSDLVDAALAIIIGLADGLIASLPKLLNRLPKIVQNIVDVIVDNVPKLLDAAIEIIAKLGEYLTDPKNLIDILDAGLEIIVAFIDGAKRFWWKLGKMAEDMIQAIADTLGLGEYRKWGMDMIENFIDGIKEKAADLWDAVKGIGQGIKDFIGFSEPDKGPLSNFHTFAPDMVKLFTEGIRDNKKSIFSEINDISTNIKDTFNEPISVNAGVHAKETFSGFDIPDISGVDFMNNLINGIKSKENSLSDVLNSVAENIRNTFEKPISVNTDITIDKDFNRLNIPDISTVAENIYTVKSDNAQSYQTEKESPVTVENLNIYVEGMKLETERELEKFTEMMANRLNALKIRKSSGIGGVII